jgi:hypothetical protein
MRQTILAFTEEVALDLYSPSPRFEYRSGNRLSCLRFFVGFPQSLQANAGTVPEWGHDIFRPNPFRFITHLSSHHRTLCNQINERVDMLCTRTETNNPILLKATTGSDYYESMTGNWRPGRTRQMFEGTCGPQMTLKSHFEKHRFNALKHKVRLRCEWLSCSYNNI